MSPMCSLLDGRADELERVHGRGAGEADAIRLDIDRGDARVVHLRAALAPHNGCE